MVTRIFGTSYNYWKLKDSIIIKFILTTMCTSPDALHHCVWAILPNVLPFVDRPNICSILTRSMVQCNILDQSTDLRLFPMRVNIVLEGIEECIGIRM